MLISLLATTPSRKLSPKAASLVWLSDQKMAVPEAYLWQDVDGKIPTPADLHFADDGLWAVRSSANVEDGTTASFAGQFETVLEVSGAENLAANATRIMSAASRLRVNAYRDNLSIDTPIAVDVVFQRIVPAVCAGVAFSRNPLTGLNEIIIEAVDGFGDRLVDEGITPRRWIWRGEDFTLSPKGQPGEADFVAEIAQKTASLAKAYGQPIDLEWACDGEKIWWLQARPITALTDLTIYSSRISREVMPGMIKPMVWSINVPAVNGAWIDLIERAVGPAGLMPEDLARQFAFRSYFNMSAMGRIFELIGMPRDGLEMLLGLPNTPRPQFKFSLKTVAMLPRLVALVWWLLTFAGTFQKQVPDLRNRFIRIADFDFEKLTDIELLECVDELRYLTAQTAQFNIVVPLLALAYAGALRKQVDRAGGDGANVDLKVGDAAFEKFDPNPMLHQLHIKLAALNNKPTGGWSYDTLPIAIRVDFQAFLKAFGHFSQSGNDLSVRAWREQPDAIVAMAEAMGDRQGIHSEKADLDEMRNGFPLWLRPGFDFLRRRARQFQLLREEISFIYTFGYGQLRPALLEIGRRMVENGNLSKSEDIMFITMEELAVHFPGEPANALITTVAQRQSEYDAALGLSMPEIIYGEKFEPMPAEKGAQLLHGLGSSRGQHRGVARVLRGTEDFPSVNKGDVIVIPFSDVGWTPVFARAGAVVAEAGGMLSHSSIVAREYGIPCVVSVAGAMSIEDGIELFVDGYAGQVMALESTE